MSWNTSVWSFFGLLAALGLGFIVVPLLFGLAIISLRLAIQLAHWIEQGYARRRFIVAPLMAGAATLLVWADAKLYPTYNAVLADLNNKKLDLAFIEEPVLASFKKRKDLKLADSYVFRGVDTLGFAFKKGSPIRAEFDQYVAELGPKAVKAIVSKWMN